MDMHEQPTMPWHGEESVQGLSAAGQQEATLPVTQPTTPSIVDGKRAGGISRRKLVYGLAGVGTVAAASGVAIEWWQHRGGNATGSGPVASTMQAGHLLRRAGFGATPQDLATYTAPGLSYSSAVDRLINYQNVSDDAMEKRLAALNLDLSKPLNQQHWWLLRMAWTQRPLLEKMTLFWHGHFTSSFHKIGGVNDARRMIVQNQFLRAHAFDTFDNLLLGITSDPAMLIYLDLNSSRKRAPNENYARELMELFTLGLGNYTQQDVTQGAAALTGWHVKAGATVANYYPQDHNIASKTYLGHTGNLDYKDVVSILANHPATSRFIARKLFSFFAYENPSNSDLEPLVNAYTQSKHNMGEVMRALLLSPQFTSTKAYRSRVKSPTEFVVGAYRGLGIQSNGSELPGATTLLGQSLLDPPNVAGWPGDKVSALWINSGTWMTRLNYLDTLLVRGRSQNGAFTPVDLQAVVNANHIASPEQFVDHFTTFMLDGNVDPERRTQFIDYFTASDTGKNRGGFITLADGKRYPLNRVRGTLYLILASPEYQLN